jgi:hypothetical protein
MSNQAKLWISLFIVACDIGLVMYLLASAALSPIILMAAAAIMVISSIHVVLIIWFGEKWHSTPEFRSFLKSLTSRAD